MKCPRCGQAWDAPGLPCPHCGLQLQLPDFVGGGDSAVEEVGGHGRDNALTVPGWLERDVQSSPSSSGERFQLTSGIAVPSRPRVSPSSPEWEAVRVTASSPSLRPRRLRSLPLASEAINERAVAPSMPSVREPDLRLPTPPDALLPGTLLRSERYRLQSVISHQDWGAGTSETTWVARDAQRASASVTICELALAESGLLTVQTLLRTATIALTSVGRHPRIPTLWDVFSERGRHFFVFEPVEGENLLVRLQRQGGPLSEQDVLECCWQMTELLDLFAQQPTPLLHGMIRPEHILVDPRGHIYLLTNFSLVLAGQEPQFLAHLDQAALSPYTAAEFVADPTDLRSDIYALLATAYHLLTGTAPTPLDAGRHIRPARSIHPELSAELAVLLEKGLHPVVSERYQRTEELRLALQELLVEPQMVSSQSDAVPTGLASSARLRALSTSPKLPLSAITQMSPLLPYKSKSGQLQIKPDMMVPTHPGFLPEINQGKEMRLALYWTVAVLLVLLLMWLLSRLLLA